MKKILTLTLFLGSIFFSLTGCFALPMEDPIPPPPIARVPEARQLRVAPVTRGNVYNTVFVSATYVPAREERLVFPIDVVGLRISNIYVGLGEDVQEGDIIAAVDWPEIQVHLESAEIALEGLKLELSHLNMRHRQSLREAYILREPLDDSGYVSAVMRLNQRISVAKTEIAHLQDLNMKRFLRATMNGSVSQVVNLTYGMLANHVQTIAVIADSTYSVFEARSPAALEHMHIGDYFIFTMNREQYKMVVADPDELGIERGGFPAVYLVFAEEHPVIFGRQTISTFILLEKAENVLNIHTRALNTAAGRTFVFVMDEQGVRAIRDVEIGLRGSARVEIISGLEEGELVVDE